MTTNANLPHATARAAAPRLLVVVLLAFVSLGGSGLVAATASASGPSQLVTSASDEAPVTGTAEATIRQRSLVRRRGLRQHPTVTDVADGDQHGGTAQWSLLRRLLLLVPMWRGPPLLRL